MRRLSACAAILAASVTFAACGGDEETTDPAPSGGNAATTLDITAQEPDGAYAFDPAELTADAGAVTVAFDNPSSDQAPHNVVIEGNGVNEATEVVEPGNQTELTTDLEPGEYTFYCAIGDHREEGMEGTLTIE